MTTYILTAILYLCAIQVCTALRWTSSGSLPTGKTIPTCSGQDVTLAWNYHADAEEHVMNVEWHFAPLGGQPTVIATQVMGSFFAAPTASQHLQFIPNAGIRLQNVTPVDTGTYSVRLNMDVHGSVVNHEQTAEVLVSDASLTTDGQLHVTMLPEAVYDSSTQQYHVQLVCGQFKAVWAPSVSVLWTTPSGQNLQSTGYENGRFLLSIPNPVTSGEYTCAVDHNSAANACVDRGSALQRGTTTTVDAVDAKFAMMEAKIKSVQLDKDQLEARHQQELAAMQQALVNQMNSLLDIRMQQIENTMANFTASHGTGRSIAFHGDILHHRALTNDGQAFNAVSGIFQVPVDGTYVFLVNVVTNASGGTRHYQILLDSATVSDCYAKKLFSGGAQGSCHAILSLRAGQRVELSRTDTDNIDSFYFSGALLHAN